MGGGVDTGRRALHGLGVRFCAFLIAVGAWAPPNQKISSGVGGAGSRGLVTFGMLGMDRGVAFIVGGILLHCGFGGLGRRMRLSGHGILLRIR